MWLVSIIRIIWEEIKKPGIKSRENAPAHTGRVLKRKPAAPVTEAAVFYVLENLNLGYIPAPDKKIWSLRPAGRETALYSGDCLIFAKRRGYCFGVGAILRRTMTA